MINIFFVRNTARTLIPTNTHAYNLTRETEPVVPED